MYNEEIEDRDLKAFGFFTLPSTLFTKINKV